MKREDNITTNTSDDVKNAFNLYSELDSSRDKLKEGKETIANIREE